MPRTRRASSRSRRRSAASAAPSAARASAFALAYRAQVVVAGAYSRGSHSFQLQLLNLFKINHLFITSVYRRSIMTFLRFLSTD